MIHNSLRHRTIGDFVPKARIVEINNQDEVKDLTYSELFEGKRVMVIGFPGAFTPICTHKHIPGFEQRFDQFIKKRLDAIYAISLNDAFVLKGWSKSIDCKKIRFLSDCDGTFTKCMGMEEDYSESGLGTRSARYVMIVSNGTIENILLESEDEAHPERYGPTDAQNVIRKI